MANSTRRAFLQGMGAAATALGFSGTVRPAWAIPPIGRTRPSHLKLSIAAYSYRDLLTSKPPKMDMFSFVDLAADLGIDAVEPTSYYFPADATSEYFRKLQQHAFRLGLDISGTAIGNDFCVKPGPDRDKQLALTKTWIDNAAAMGAPVIRIFAGKVHEGQTEDEAVALAVEGIKASLPYAAEKGVTLAIENHGGITLTAPQLLKLVAAVDAPNFGVNLDTGNFHGDDPYAELAELAPFAVNVQVKTEISRKGKKKENADLGRVINILRDAHYSGYVVLEYEAPEDPLTAIPGHIKTLRSLIG